MRFNLCRCKLLLVSSPLIFVQKYMCFTFRSVSLAVITVFSFNNAVPSALHFCFHFDDFVFNAETNSFISVDTKWVFSVWHSPSCIVLCALLSCVPLSSWFFSSIRTASLDCSVSEECFEVEGLDEPSGSYEGNLERSWDKSWVSLEVKFEIRLQMSFQAISLGAFPIDALSTFRSSVLYLSSEPWSQWRCSLQWKECSPILIAIWFGSSFVQKC